MTPTEISAVVRQFLERHIGSAEELDILLFLHRSQGQELTAREVGQSVYTPPASATMRLERLAVQGFLASTGGADPRYSYRPASPELGREVDALAAAYAQDRVAVIRIVHASAPDPRQTFADAFRLRGKDS